MDLEKIILTQKDKQHAPSRLWFLAPGPQMRMQYGAITETNQHSYHPPPKKLLFAANGDTTENHTWTRDRQRFAGLLEPVETPAASPASMVQGMRRKRWCDVCKSQSTRESAVRLSSLERAAQRPEQRRYSQTC
ncbi:hypothetical protein LEMLEM_LOCUS795 [Lemmus lemmus]